LARYTLGEKMAAIKLTNGELSKIHDLSLRITQCNDVNTVTITQSENSGIGTTITAAFRIKHEGQVGDFVVTITDFTDW
jgi:hypothetical protein